MPADDNHPYGHTKAEYLSAVIEGVLIILAALAILRESWQGFIAPRPIDAPALGLAISGARSEAGRVGTECVRTCSTRWWPDHSTKKQPQHRETANQPHI